MRTGRLGAVRIGELSASKPGGADRKRQHIRLMDADICKVDVVTQGEILVEQLGRQAHLKAGDYALVDLSHTAHWRNTRASRLLSIAFPRRLLPFHADDVMSLFAVPFRADDAPGALFSSTARQLARDFGNFDPVSGVRIGTATLDLLTVALAGRLDRGAELPPDVPQHALILRICAFIEDQLADPDLKPETVARAHHVSLRYLYKLFEGEQVSVTGLIRQRRLDHCRRDLLDPALRHVPVSAIAARWGLLNAAHFARAFRAAYGASPVEYRRLATAAGRG
jgi:AraC-like DNA-binding protein